MPHLQVDGEAGRWQLARPVRIVFKVSRADTRSAECRRLVMFIYLFFFFLWGVEAVYLRILIMIAASFLASVTHGPHTNSRRNKLKRARWALGSWLCSRGSLGVVAQAQPNKNTSPIRPISRFSGRGGAQKAPLRWVVPSRNPTISFLVESSPRAKSCPEGVETAGASFPVKNGRRKRGTKYDAKILRSLLEYVWQLVK